MQNRDLNQKILLLLSREHLLSAQQIVQQLQTEGLDYNKTSVYRALDRLIDQQQVCELHFAGTEALYELKAHHHSHLVCQKCGQVSEAACDLTEKTKIGDFTVDHHHVTFMGTCADCSTK